MRDLEHTEDFATVTWRGRELTFSAQQRAAVKLLIEQRGRGLSQAHILERIGSSSSRLRDVFKSRNGMHPAWGTLIEAHPQQRDIFLVPREIPEEPPERPQSTRNTSSSSGSSVDEPARGGPSVSQSSTMSLISAYAFGAEQGLGREVNDIRRMQIHRSSSRSSVRRGYIIELFEKRGIFEKFKAEHWLPGNTEAGATKRRRYLRLKREHEGSRGKNTPDRKVTSRENARSGIPVMRTPAEGALAASPGGWRNPPLALLQENRADEFFELWAAHLESTPPWTVGSSETNARIPYPLLHSPARFQVPDVPGFYLWGANLTVEGSRRFGPRYFGRATGSLLTRLVNLKGRFVQGQGRFVPGPKGPVQDVPEQCALATIHYDQIVEAAAGVSNTEYARGLREGLMNTLRKDTILWRYLDAAFPPERLARFRASNSPGTLRLRQAIDFALHGGADLKELWLALIPLPGGLSDDAWDRLEEDLIRAIRRWNEACGLPLPLNAIPSI